MCKDAAAGLCTPRREETTVGLLSSISANDIFHFGNIIKNPNMLPVLGDTPDGKGEELAVVQLSTNYCTLFKPPISKSLEAIRIIVL